MDLLLFDEKCQPGDATRAPSISVGMREVAVQY